MARLTAILGRPQAGSNRMKVPGADRERLAAIPFYSAGTDERVKLTINFSPGHFAFGAIAEYEA